MALVRDIKDTTKDHPTLHEPTECLASIFTDREGRRVIQLDTYGSSQRKMPGKVSQALQFDERAASQLKDLIERAFPGLRK